MAGIGGRSRSLPRLGVQDLHMLAPRDVLPRLLASRTSRSASVDNAPGGRVVEGNAGAQQTLGDFLGLLIYLLDSHEVAAVAAILEDLASSELAHTELTCTQSAFRSQIGDGVNTHASRFSNNVARVIQRWCLKQPMLVWENEELEIMSAPPVLSPTVSLRSDAYQWRRRDRSLLRRGSSSRNRSTTSESSRSDEDDRRPFGHSFNGPRQPQRGPGAASDGRLRLEGIEDNDRPPARGYQAPAPQPENWQFVIGDGDDDDPIWTADTQVPSSESSESLESQEIFASD